MSGAYGYGFEVNSGWKGYNTVYTLDDTTDNLLSKNHNAEPCCAQKRPDSFPVAWPPKDTYTDPTPRVNETRVIGSLMKTNVPTLSQAKLLYIGIAVLLIVIFMKLVA